MKKKSKISLGFLIFGSAITLVGLPLFITGGVGVKNLNIPTDNGMKKINSGYFSYSENFEILKGKSNFTEDLANQEGYSFDFYGFSKYMLNQIDDNDLPQVPTPSYLSINSIDDIKSFYQNVLLNKPLFITGSVLWPIGLTTILVSLPIFISFKHKGE